MLGLNELIMQFSDSFDALSAEGLQRCVESLVFSEEGLHGAQVPTIILGADLGLAICDPQFYHIRLPHELEKGVVVQQETLSTLRNAH